MTTVRSGTFVIYRFTAPKRVPVRFRDVFTANPLTKGDLLILS